MSEFRLPLRYRLYAFLARLSHRVGLRGGALLSLGFMALTYGRTLAYGPPTAVSAQVPWPESASLYIGVVFAAVGLICIVSAFTTRPARDRPAFALAVGTCTAWGLGFIVLGEQLARGMIFLALAALTFICARIPEHPLLSNKALPTLPPDPLYLGTGSAENTSTPPNDQDPAT